MSLHVRLTGPWFGRCVERILGLVARGDAELMVASHNQASVENASRCMHRLGLDPSSSGEGAACHCRHTGPRQITRCPFLTILFSASRIPAY